MSDHKDPEFELFSTTMNRMLSRIQHRTKELWWKLQKANYRKDSGELMDAYELFFEALRQSAWEVDLSRQGHSEKEIHKLKELAERERWRGT